MNIKKNKKSNIELYVEQYKNIIIPELLNQFEEKINYMPNKKINKTMYDEAEFENYFDVYSTNSLITMQLLTSDIMEFFIDFQCSIGIDVYLNQRFDLIPNLVEWVKA